MTTRASKFFHRDSSIPTPIDSRHPDAFKLAGDMILDAHESAEARPHNDHLVYPVLYLYRHCLELKLKELVALGVRTGDLKVVEVKKILGKHDLKDLWQRAKFLIRKSYPKDTGKLTAIQAVILKYHQFDDDGQKLRYDRDKDRKLRPYRATLPSHFTVGELRAEMQSTYEYLGNAHAGIAEHWDAMQASLPD